MLMMVASIVATIFSFEPVMAKPSAAQTVNVFPARFTCALATSTSPAAGANRCLLELHRKHVFIIGRDRQGRVAAGRIENGGDSPRVQVTVLLCQFRGEGQTNLDHAFSDYREFGSQGGHEGLTRKASPDPLFPRVHRSPP
jgi:hypothetical protein